jgi:hypothetical protein
MYRSSPLGRGAREMANAVSIPPLTFITLHHHIVLHHPTSYRLHSFCATILTSMSTNSLKWSCSTCGARLRKPRRVHESCGGKVRYTCVQSGVSGEYYKRRRHILHCRYCSPDLAEALDEEKAIRDENQMETIEGKDEGENRRLTFTACSPPTSSKGKC